jgi:hypothetical protein
MEPNLLLNNKKRTFHFAQILPNNDRVSRKTEIEKFEEEEKERLIEFEKEKKLKELNSEEQQRNQQREREKKQKQRDEEFLKEDKKEREIQVAKMVNNRVIHT